MSTMVLYNGTVHTLVPGEAPARAVAIRDGRILAVGSEGKVQAAAGSRAEMVNLQGRAVVPGLTDAHVHITFQGLAAREVRLGDAATLTEALHRIAAEAPRGAGDAWLKGGGWSHIEWGRWPTRDDLDMVSRGRPAILTRKDGHSIWVNSRALELAGITDATPDPAGGQIQRDQAGRATGILLETAMDLVRAVVPPPTPADRLDALGAAFQEALSYGLTSLHLPPSMRETDGRETLADLQLLRQAGALPIRCLAHLSIGDLDAAVALGVRSGLGDRWIRVGGLKLFADGSLGSESAEMLAYYEGRRHRGIPTIGEEQLWATVQQANRHGIAVTIHAIGDAANRKVLDAIEAARPAVGGPGLAMPNRIEHVQVLHQKDLPRLAALGVVASMQPIHATSDMAVADELWGARCGLAYAWRSLLSSGATLAFGSDAPVETMNPWPGVHAAVTRQRADGTPAGGWYPEQRLSVAEALAAYCVGPAVASSEQDEKGTIAPGKLADLAVLTADPFRCPPADLQHIAASMTIVEGRVVYERR